MRRLRRLRCETSPFHVAAEVCETRALLSAVAAVHGAVQHAQAFSHAAPAPAAKASTVAVDFKLDDTIGTVHAPGVVTISPIVPTAGAHVKAHVFTAYRLGLTDLVFNISLSAKVQSAVPQGDTTVVTLAPTGSLKMKQTLDTGKVVNLTYKVTSPLTITLDQEGAFKSLETTFVHAPKKNTLFLPLDITASVV